MRLVPHAGAPDRPPAPRSPCPPWAPLPATSALAPGCSQPCGRAGRCWTWPAPSPARCSQVPPCWLVRGPVWPEGRGQAVRCPGSSADADTDSFCVLVTLWRPSSVTFQVPGHVSQGPRVQSGKGGQPVVVTCWVPAGPGSPPTGGSPRLLAAIGAYMAVAPAPAASPLEGLCGLCPPGSSGPACSGRAPVSGPSRRDLAPPFPRGVVPISQRSGGQARISCEACSMAEAAAEPPSWGMKGPEPPRLRGWDCFMLYQVAVEWKACASQENERTPKCPHVPVTSLWGRSSGTEGRRRAGSAVRAQHRLDLGATLRTLPEKRGR